MTPLLHPSNTIVSHLLHPCYTLSVDTAYAGYGDIEISINEYTVPCTVSKSPPTYHAKFMPQKAGIHTVDIRFNGRPIQS